jgi:hypothetical protein
MIVTNPNHKLLVKKTKIAGITPTRTFEGPGGIFFTYPVTKDGKTVYHVASFNLKTGAIRTVSRTPKADEGSSARDALCLAAGL